MKVRQLLVTLVITASVVLTPTAAHAAPATLPDLMPDSSGSDAFLCILVPPLCA